MGFRNPVRSLSASAITDGVIDGLWIIGNPAAAHAEVGTNGPASGIRLYGPDGVTVLINLDAITGSGVFTGGFRTAVSGQRYECGVSGAVFAGRFFSGDALETAPAEILNAWVAGRPESTMRSGQRGAASRAAIMVRGAVPAGGGDEISLDTNTVVLGLDETSETFIQGSCFIGPLLETALVEADLAAHAAAGDPHAGYVLESDLNVAWTSYAPTWTGSGGNPALNNGTLLGRYTKVGKKVTVAIDLLIGSLTTRGAGAWSFGLPPGLNVKAGGPSFVGQGLIIDAGTGYYIGVASAGAAASTLVGFFGFAPNNAAAFGANQLTATFPIAVPAAGDVYRLGVAYEVA